MAPKVFSDMELLELLRRDDRAAFDVLYDRYWKSLFTTAYNSTRNREDSMDICQSVFLWFWESRAVIRVNASLQAYLHSAVKYKIANQIRNGKYRESLFEDLEQVDSRVYRENELELKELQTLIAQLIDELPEKCREVFLLSRNSQLNRKEIAQQLGISVRTVDNHIANGLKKLKDPLNRLAILYLLFYFKK